jgi:hypothetical protein
VDDGRSLRATEGVGHSKPKGGVEGRSNKAAEDDDEVKEGVQSAGRRGRRLLTPSYIACIRAVRGASPSPVAYLRAVQVPLSSNTKSRKVRLWRCWHSPGAPGVV